MNAHRLFLALVLSLSMQQQTPPQPPDQIDATADALRPVTSMPELKSALRRGGRITLGAGVVYDGSITISVSGTTLVGAVGASITGSSSAPAIYIPPGVNDVSVSAVNLTTAYDQRVVQCGNNDSTQTSPDRVPRRITFERVNIPTYRGKRGFEINCANVVLDRVTVSDLYDPAGRDSQTVWIGNTPGSITLSNGTFSGGTETIMVGGDTMKIPGVVPSDITVTDCALNHPLSWRTDGTKHYVKNLFELKTGHNVTVRRTTLDGSWKDAQSGWAFMITPRNDGNINGLLVEDVTVSNVAGVFNFLGFSDLAPATVSPTQNIVIRRVTASASKAFSTSAMGIFAMLGGEVHDVSFDSITFTGDGNYFLSTYAGTVIDLATGAGRRGRAIDTLSVTNSTFTAGVYGFFLHGTANAGPTQQGVKTLTVTGNRITGATATLKKNLPQNIFK
jgi:hypothetical protein